jgi:hypothetical protein
MASICPTDGQATFDVLFAAYPGQSAARQDSLWHEGGILAAASGMIGWMFYLVAGRCCVLGGAELVWRQQRAMGRPK